MAWSTEKNVKFEYIVKRNEIGTLITDNERRDVYHINVQKSLKDTNERKCDSALNGVRKKCRGAFFQMIQVTPVILHLPNHAYEK